MTITINLPEDAEATLRDQAEKAGVSLDRFVERLVLDRFVSARTRIDRLVAAIGDPTVILEDVSREAIYGE